MVAAARQVLGGSAAVLVQEVDALPSDAGAETLAGSLHADAVVEVRWPDPDRRRARVHMWIVPQHKWSDRDIEFAPADDAKEKGKTVGIAFAAMVPSEHEATPPPPPPPVVEDHPPPPPPRPPPIVVTPKPFDRWWAITGAVTDSSGIGGTAHGIGGDIAAEWWFARSTALRVGASGRFGDIDPEEISVTTYALSAGLMLATPGKLSASLRVDAFGARQEFSRSVFGSDQSAARFVGGADAVAGANYWVAPYLALMASFGVEATIGKTRVFVDDDQVATVPLLRLTMGAGVRIRF